MFGLLLEIIGKFPLAQYFIALAKPTSWETQGSCFYSEHRGLNKKRNKNLRAGRLSRIP